MKVLVVGGAGYIGSHTTYELIRAGHEVVVLDNLSTGRQHNVHPQTSFYWGDIRHKSDITRVLEAEHSTGKPIDVAMHFAAKLIVPQSVSQPLAYYENNVEGLRTMLEALVECNVRNVVFSSTAAVYGEPDAPECSEDGPTKPINPYGETKLACEKMIQWVAAAHGLNYCILRYFNVAGADESLEIGLDKDYLTWLIPLIMQAALGIRDKLFIYGNDYNTPDGTCIRDYIHVTDLAQAHVLGAEYILKNQQSLLCNLGSGSGYSVKEVLDAALELFPVPFEYAARRPGDPDILIANIDRARKLLGWEPTRNLRTILKSDYDFRRKLAESRRG
ncbi:MAG: UDP-glucose 4-epimerase GalE [Coriobacteriales bacterium]|jgi:UDP-glucose 4-epimerase|nr:UDP-glucose 4-epimerase GalE [Coriobacteriales bacterium]